MRFTRAAKVAAFPLTALILVALVACQGPAGPAGAAGGKGDQGSMGDQGLMGNPGGPGPAGADALVATSATGPTIFISDGKAVNGDATPGAAQTVDLVGLFAGGVGEVTYTATLINAEMPDVKGFIEISQSGSMLTITLKKVAAAATEMLDRYDPIQGYMISVKAKDSADVEVTSNSLISVVQNRAPTMKIENGNPIPSLRIGTQPDKVPAGHAWPRTVGANETRNSANLVGNPYTCATFNACILKFVQSSDFTTVEADGGIPNYHFFDYGTLTYEARVDADKAGYISITPVAGGIMIAGLKSTVKTVEAALQNRFVVDETQAKA